MVKRRKDDGPCTQSWFRSERMIESGNEWFFHSREGMKGPFASRADAQFKLDAHLNLLEYALTKNIPELSLEPIEARK